MHPCYGGVCDLFQGCSGGLGGLAGGKGLRRFLPLILPGQLLPEFGGELPSGQEFPILALILLLFCFLAGLDVPLMFPNVWKMCIRDSACRARWTASTGT